MQKKNHLIGVLQALWLLFSELLLFIIRFLSALLFWSGYLLQKIGAFGLRRIP